MTAPLATFNLTAPVNGVTGPVNPGDVLVPVGGVYVVATPANLAAAGERAHGVAVTGWASNTTGAVTLQHVGIVPTTVSGLGAGAASSLRVSAAGRLERAAVSGTDDVVGRCDADGNAFVLFGILTAAIVNGGGSGYTPPTGTGFPHITSGAQDAASRAVNIASTDVTGTLPIGSGGTGLTALTIPASAILAGTTDAQTLTNKTLVAASNTITDTSAATGDILRHNGTRFVRLARGSANQVLQTNAGATDIAWATLSGTTSPGGSTTQVQYNNAGAFAGNAQFVFNAATGAVGIGPGTLATSGVINVGGGGGLVTQMAWYDTTQDRAIVRTLGTRILIGDDGINTEIRGTAYLMQSSGLNGAFVSGGAFNMAVPIIGSALDAVPYSVHGGFSFAMAITSGSYTVTAAQYQYDHCEFTTGTLTGAFTTVWPAPASLAQGYYKTITNATTQTMTVSIGSGTTKTLTTNLSQRFWFDSNGVQFASPTFTR